MFFFRKKGPRLSTLPFLIRSFWSDYKAIHVFFLFYNAAVAVIFSFQIPSNTEDPASPLTRR